MRGAVGPGGARASPRGAAGPGRERGSAPGTGHGRRGRLGGTGSVPLVRALVVQLFGKLMGARRSAPAGVVRARSRRVGPGVSGVGKRPDQSWQRDVGTGGGQAGPGRHCCVFIFL